MESSKPRLWIVDPSLHHAEEQGVAEIARDWPGPWRLFRPALRPGNGPDPAAGYDTDGVVVMGSAASVHDDLPWMGGLTAWLGPLLRGELRRPLLGICFGHQLVAHAAGGGVGFVREDRAKIVGVETSELAGGRLLPGGHRLRVVVSHREQVTRLPAGYRVVARRESSPIDGLEHEELPIFGFQFHPEAREEFARRAGIPPERVDARVREDSRRLLEAFRRRVASGVERGAGRTVP